MSRPDTGHAARENSSRILFVTASVTFNQCMEIAEEPGISLSECCGLCFGSSLSFSTEWRHRSHSELFQHNSHRYSACSIIQVIVNGWCGWLMFVPTVHIVHVRDSTNIVLNPSIFNPIWRRINVLTPKLRRENPLRREKKGSSRSWPVQIDRHFRSQTAWLWKIIQIIIHFTLIR